ncbi:MAG TPA: tetratricopeptide repeat protein, partial [Thermoanaerobaculia bacterium]|nr:tetratricopeptide repeat protein [Thermoanaerobaculia bacterium]
NLPVSADGLAHMLGGDVAEVARIAATRASLARLADLSLVVRLSDDDVWVHRWTAEGLARMSEPAAHAARCTAAGRYRVWRVEHETHDLGNAIEALRNFLAGRAFDEATTVAKACFDALRRFGQSVGIAALAGEVLESLPEDHARYAAVADEEATAHLALGFTQRAVQRYEELLRAQKARAEAEPERADSQRVLSVLYNRIGDVYRALGEGEKAREAYLKDLAIAERLAEAEPERADYQRDLSVSYNKIGDVYRALGEWEKAREAYLKSLAIRERLAEAEPERADYQRDLSVSYERIGDMYGALGEGEKAREAYLESLAIRERLAEAEPDRADYQRDLSISYNKIGDVYRALGDGEKAREALLKSLAIRERLAEAEPDRADYQVDLATSLRFVGLLGPSPSRPLLERALAILQRLHAEGRLAPQDQRKIANLEKTLGEIE